MGVTAWRHWLARDGHRLVAHGDTGGRGVCPACHHVEWITPRVALKAWLRVRSPRLMRASENMVFAYGAVVVLAQALWLIARWTMWR